MSSVRSRHPAPRRCCAALRALASEDGALRASCAGSLVRGMWSRRSRMVSSGERLLAGRSALVTGSTSGIGLAIARGLAQQGANVVVNGHGDPDEVDRIVKELQDIGVEAFYADADLRDPQAIDDMFEKARDR